MLGRIFSYVLHEVNEAYQQRIVEQESAIHSANLVDLFCVKRNIGMFEANKGSNVSHFLLQYDLKRSHFLKFTMRIASGHVHRNLQHDMSQKDLANHIITLYETFINGQLYLRELYTTSLQKKKLSNGKFMKLLNGDFTPGDCAKRQALKEL